LATKGRTWNGCSICYGKESKRMDNNRLVSQLNKDPSAADLKVGVRMSRRFCLPSPQTFSMLPVRQLLTRHIREGSSVLDPFAANARWGTRTNDLNPHTRAQDHMDAEAWLNEVMGEGVQYDVVLLDPPYSPRQVKEVFKGFGRKVTQRDTQGATLTAVRDKVAKLLIADGTVISFGWNSVGMGFNRGFRQKEIVLVSHGRHHNDTIVVVEERFIMERERK
jgi:hypothetical protein